MSAHDRTSAMAGCALVLASALLACSTRPGQTVQDDGDADARVSDALVSDVVDPSVSFVNDVHPIVRARCATAGCHDTSTQTNHWTNFSEPASTYSRWVNGPGFDFCVPGGVFVTKVVVVPGRPQESYLLQKVSPARDEPCEDPTHHRRMPPEPLPSLSAGEIETFTRWIADGALQN